MNKRMSRTRRPTVLDMMLGLAPPDVGGGGITVNVFTDGSSPDNGKKTARAGYGVFFGDDDIRNCAEPFYAYPFTNNRAELFACIKAIEQFSKYQELIPEGPFNLVINSDSKYVIDSMTKWIDGWRAKGWKTANKKDVLNQDLIVWLDKLIQSAPFSITFNHVSSHSKRPEEPFYRHGNDMADQLANEGAEKFFR